MLILGCYSFRFVDQKEGSLSGGFGGISSDGPDHRREIVQPLLATDLELGIKAFGLEALEDFRICAFSLSIAPGVGKRGKSDLGVDGGTVLPE
jgi:hypothetical protein